MGREVIGVLDEPPGGWGSGSRWIFCVTLMPWTDGTTPGTAPLDVLVPCTEQQLNRAMYLNANDAIKVALTRFVNPNRAYGRLPLKKVKPSKALFAAASARNKPVALKDKRLGRLTLDRGLDSYVGRAPLWGKRIEVIVNRSSNKDDAARDARDVTAASAAHRGLSTQRTVIMTAIAEKMLPLYNKTWRDDDARELSPPAFLRRIKPTGVTLAKTRTTIYFDADDMFTDHAIEVRINARGKIADVHLAG